MTFPPSFNGNGLGAGDAIPIPWTGTPRTTSRRGASTRSKGASCSRRGDGLEVGENLFSAGHDGMGSGVDVEPLAPGMEATRRGVEDFPYGAQALALCDRELGQDV